MVATPIRDTDDEARELARGLLSAMRHATLAVLDPETGYPQLSRIACQSDADGQPLALLSSLAAHTRALIAEPRAGLLIDDPTAKGDPMTRPRLSLQVRATRLGPDSARHARWLKMNPKARIYIDLPDFSFWELIPTLGFLNAGFGAAFRLTPDDLRPPPDLSGGGP